MIPRADCRGHTIDRLRIWDFGFRISGHRSIQSIPPGFADRYDPTPGVSRVGESRSIPSTPFAGRSKLTGEIRTPARERALHDLNVLALIKGGERFVYVYDDVSREAVIAALRDQAADPEVTLNWFDAAVLTERARHQATRSEGHQPSRI